MIEGVNGFGFDDEQSFLDVIIPLIDNSDYRKEIGRNARDSVEKYSLENFAINLEKIYYQFLNTTNS